MEISYNWLREYIPLKVNAEELARILTDLGLEVSSVTKFSSVKGALEGIVIGEVVECRPHPNSDHLSITKVNTGSEELLDIVCGASNVAKGQKVVVATVGTSLYGMEEPLTIKKSKIRGEVSEGMICAEDEIGLGTSHAGIMVLPENAKVGMPAKEYFNVEEDFVLEVDLTPNRIDSASHIGIARDLAAYFCQFEKTNYTKPEIKNFVTGKNPVEIDVEIENSEACPRYMGLHIKNIKIAPSPQWLQNRLKAIGLNPINNVVDISNFILFETGHPLHMFDASKIKGNKVTIKTLPDKTEFITLDGTERSLSSNDLMICNQNGGMCIAGVFGGLDAGISDNTKDIFIESAYFSPAWIRRTAKRHSISTDSSFRFERGVDPNMAPYALKRAASLVLELAGGQVVSEIVDVYPKLIEPVEVECRYSHFDRLTGIKLEKENIHSILNSLEIELTNVNKHGFTAIVPTYRVDVTREADIIEDFLRVYGYNNVVLPDKMVSSLTFTVKPDRNIIENNLAEMLAASGFSEIMCTSFTKSKYFDLFPESHPVVSIYNPLSSDLNCMRPTLLFGGLECIIRNINYQQRDLMIFEIGRIYHLHPEMEDKPGKRYTETNSLGLWITGNKQQAHWNETEIKSNFFTIKAYTETILKRCGIAIDDLQTVKAESNKLIPVFNYSKNEKFIAEVGMVNHSVLKALDIDQEVFFARIDMDAVMKIIKNRRTKVETLPKFPKVRRDLALLIDSAVKYESIRELAFKTEKKLLKQVQVFDVYQGKNIPEGKKSYAISFILQDDEKTLNDKEIDKVMQKLTYTFNKELGAQLR